MIPFVALAVIIAVSFSLLLFNTFSSFRNFHQQSKTLSLWDTMTLASTNRVIHETNSFLAALKDSLNKSVKSYDPSKKTVDVALNAERLTIIQDYLSKLDISAEDSPIKKTIEFGLHPYDNQGAKNYSDSFNATLIHSDYLPIKINEDDKTYTSSLVTDNQVSEKINVDELEDEMLDGDKFVISADLLAKLVDADAYNLIESNPALFNIEINNDGLSLDDLPNGVEVDVTTSSQTSR